MGRPLQVRGLAILVTFVALAPCAAQSSTGLPDRTLPWVTDEVNAPRVAYRKFHSKSLGGDVSYHVFTPAAYDRTEERLPVLYWLHGTDGGVVGVRPMARLFNDAMQAGKVPAMIVVFVNGLPRRLWADSKDGASPVETVFIKDVIPDVDKKFRTLAQREGRILEGFSMGGYGAARLGFKHPDLFAGISILAGGPLDLEFMGPRARQNPRLRELILRDVCANDLNYFKAISPWTIAETAAAALRDYQTVIRHAVGDLDDTCGLNRHFHKRMTDLQIAHEYFELPNVGHDAPALLAALGDRNDRFYWRVLEPADAEPKK
ncbi:MAG TPA: alpha/beta hydrolase-fold protein [Gemmatales bacterium]|nr:alpha/beta hydrolase-fold protein [Gemmatales bacterium]